MKKLYAKLDSKYADLIVVENGNEKDALQRGYSEVEPVFSINTDGIHCLACAYVTGKKTRLTMNYLNEETYKEIMSVVEFPKQENSKFFKMMNEMFLN